MSTRVPVRIEKTFQANLAFRQGLFASFSSQNGLAWINAMVQDSRGHLWIGTDGYGLIRYDGAYFTTFMPYEGLKNGRISAVIEDRQGRLWIGTDRLGRGLEGTGIYCLDGDTWIGYDSADGLISDDVASLYADRQGRIWAGCEGGVSCYDGGHFQNFTAQDGLVGSRISCIVEDRQGHLWFGSGHGYGAEYCGLSRYDGASFCPITAADGLDDDRVITSFVDGEGTLFFGTWTGAYRCADGRRFTPVESLPSLKIYAIVQDGRGHMWFSAFPDGVWCFNGFNWTHFDTADGLVNSQVRSLYLDRHDNLWLGTLTGISRRDQGAFDHFTMVDGLTHNGVLSLAEDREGGMWVGTMRGVSRWTGTRFEPCGETADWNVWSILRDRQGRMWFACSTAGSGHGGLGCYDGECFRSFTTADGLADNDVWQLLEDSKGRIWAGSRSSSGVNCYDGQGFRVFTKQDGLAGDRIHAILEDRQGTIWFGTNEGVSRYDGYGFSAFKLVDHWTTHWIYCLLEDRQGRIWFGTWGDGLAYYDGRDLHTLSTWDGLSFDQVSFLFEDRRGHLWIGTYGGGISRYDGLVFQQLSREDGLLHDAIQELFEDRHGHIWIATEGGLIRYCSSTHAPTIRLQAVIADQRYSPNGTVTITGAQKMVAFEFEGISQSTPLQRMAYVCRLQGVETEWRPVYEDRIEYQGLPEGEYTFEVKAVDRDLNYSQPVQVQVSIEPDALVESLTSALGQNGSQGEFVGRSQALRAVQARLAQVAATDFTVLILGETGTGKGLAARTLHRMSPRQDKPFVQVNCGALPEALIESELFGHEKGAFTGATNRRLGKVEIARDGTLFLDEIGDMSPMAQVKLLRLLEEHTFERLGSEKTQEAQVRIVAATNRDLPAQIEAGTFRQDLYFRLCGFEVDLPPLRQRTDDIPLLALYFIEVKAAHLDKSVPALSPLALDALVAHAWPGNVRELEHTIGRAVVVCREGDIRVEDLGLAAQAGVLPTDEKPVSLAEWERRYIVRILEQKKWVISGPQGAAAVLGLNEATLRSRMKKLGIVRSKL
jgi:DNA-binding NtrC family response regulator/ligand-binding sensor domain-containing protein